MKDVTVIPGFAEPKKISESWTYDSDGFDSIKSTLSDEALRAIRNKIPENLFLKNVFDKCKSFCPKFRVSEDGIYESDEFAIVDNGTGCPDLNAKKGAKRMSFEFMEVDADPEKALRREQGHRPDQITKELKKLNDYLDEYEPTLPSIQEDYEASLNVFKQKKDRAPQWYNFAFVIGIFFALTFAEVFSFYVAFANNFFGVQATISSLLRTDTAFQAWGAIFLSISLFVVVTMLAEQVLVATTGDDSNFFLKSKKIHTAKNLIALLGINVVSFFVALIREVRGFEDALKAIENPSASGVDWKHTFLLFLITLAVPFGAALTIRIFRSLLGNLFKSKDAENEMKLKLKKLNLLEHKINTAKNDVETLNNEAIEAKKRQEELLENRFSYALKSDAAWKTVFVTMEEIKTRAIVEYKASEEAWRRSMNTRCGRLKFALTKKVHI